MTGDVINLIHALMYLSLPPFLSFFVIPWRAIKTLRNLQNYVSNNYSLFIFQKIIKHYNSVSFQDYYIKSMYIPIYVCLYVLHRKNKNHLAF